MTHPRAGRYVTPAYAAALDAHLEGPHPRALAVVCSCGATVGRVDRTAHGLLLVAWWKDKTPPQVMDEDVSLLEREAEPFTWRCDKHGGEAVPRETIACALDKKALTINRGRLARR